MSIREKLTQIHRDLGEALALLPPDPEPEPIPPPYTIVTTSDELHAALARGGSIHVADGVYLGPFVVRDNTTMMPLAATKPVLTIGALGDPYQPVLRVVGSAVRVERFEIQSARDDREAVLVGSPTETNAAMQPDDVTFDDVSVWAMEATGGKRGFALHGRRISLINCEARGFWRKGQDSQAVWINNGPGPYLIDGGYYEASGENILLGGANIPCGQNPSAIIRNATLRKPQEWKGQGYVIKNLFEVKAGKNVTLENCILDGCWGGEGQSGWAVMLTPDTQDHDMPWLTVDDVTLTGNRFLNCEHGVSMRGVGRIGQATVPMQFATIFGNYMAPTGMGLMLQQCDDVGLSVKRNTLLTRHSFLQLHGGKINLAFVENVVSAGKYGIMGDDNVAAGLPTLTAAVHADTLLFHGNVIEQSARFPLKFPPNNTVVAPGALAGLLDPEGKMPDGSAGYGG